MERRNTPVGYLLVHQQLWVHFFWWLSCVSGVAFFIKSLVNMTVKVSQWMSVEVLFLAILWVIFDLHVANLEFLDFDISTNILLLQVHQL